jgi:octaprenyl-diphosphate synthase
MHQYGYHVGLAFQLMDDVLDYSGDAEVLGKNLGDDLAEGKPTLPLIFAMKEGSEQQSELIANALRNGDANLLNDVIAIVKATGGLEYAAQCAQQHVDAALKELHVDLESVCKQSMIELAEFAVNRSY